MLDAVLGDASGAPTWSNTQPDRIAVASGALGMLKRLLTRQGLPDGELATPFADPDDLQPRRRETGRGLFDLLAIGRLRHPGALPVDLRDVHLRGHGDRHQAVAAMVLLPLFGPAVAEPVALYVDATRYFVGHNPGDLERLSPDSACGLAACCRQST